MAARPIDGNTLIEWFRPYLHTGEAIPADVVIEDILSMPTLTQPNEWVSVEERLPEPGERVLAAKGTFAGEAYLASNGAWMRHDGFPWEVDAWMPLPAPPGKDNNVPTNEPLTIQQLREMDGEPVWIVDVGPHKWYGPGWAIVDRDNCLVRIVKNWNPVFFESYGERWLAYRRSPEGEEDT